MNLPTVVYHALAYKIGMNLADTFPSLSKESVEDIALDLADRAMQHEGIKETIERQETK